MVDKMTSASIRYNFDAMANELAVANRLIADIERGNDLLNRISKQYKPDDKISSEVLGLMDEFQEVQSMFSCESIQIDYSMESAWDVVKRIVDSMWRFLCKCWDYIRRGFNYLFNSQYRATSKFVKCKQKLALCGSSDDSSAKFEQYDCQAAITPTEFRNILEGISAVTSVLEGVIDLESASEVDQFVKQKSEQCGIEFKENKFIDSFGKIPYKGGTWGSLGWSIKLATEICGECIDVAGRTVKLKKVHNRLNDDIADLKKKIASKVERGTSDESLSEVQSELCTKTKIFTVIQAGLLCISGRLSAVETLMGDIAQDADDIANGRYVGGTSEND